MSKNTKKGNVVLIEAFVVLCLLFMVQYVLAGIDEVTNTVTRDADFFTVRLEEVETNGERVNHIAYVRIGKYLINMGASCLVDWPPDNYPFSSDTILASAYASAVKSGAGEPLAGRVFDVADSAEFDSLQQLLSHDKLDIARQAAAAGTTINGFDIDISGYLPDIDPKGLFLAVFTCACHYSLKGNLGKYLEQVELRFPHPIVLTYTKISSRTVDAWEFVGYHHFTQQLKGRESILPGLVFKDAKFTDPDPKNAYRRFDFLLLPSGKWEQSNYDSRKVDDSAVNPNE